MSATPRESSPFATIATDILRIRPHVPENLKDGFDRLSEAALQQAMHRAVETAANDIASSPPLTLIEGGRDAS